MKIKALINKYKQPFIAWTIIYGVLLFVAIIFVQLLAKTNIWIFLAIGFLYATTFKLSKSIGQVHQTVLINANTLSKAVSMLAESVQIQSRRVTDIQDFIKRLVRPAANLSIH